MSDREIERNEKIIKVLLVVQGVLLMAWVVLWGIKIYVDIVR